MTEPGAADPKTPQGPQQPGSELNAETTASGLAHARESLLAPPPDDEAELSAEQVEFYVRAAMHPDRSPGDVLVVAHPGKWRKVPRGLFAALEQAGFAIHQVETQADRVASVRGIRDAFNRLRTSSRPLDVLMISGDGSLDHHMLVAAYWALYPDLVAQVPGRIDTSAIQDDDLAPLSDDYRQAFFTGAIDAGALDASEETLRQIWLLRMRLASLLRRGKPAARIARKLGRAVDDPMLRVAVAATLWPHKVVLRSHGFNLSGLVQARRSQVFAGLYPLVRSICAFPAGTAADNAVFAGVPGWLYAMGSGLLTRFKFLDFVRRGFERRVVRRFVHYFTQASVVVPARMSFIGLDGEWQRISSHAAGGPGAGNFFTADLISKTKGMWGYLKRIPSTTIREGVFGDTVLRMRARHVDGSEKSFVEAQITEGLYTNRTFIAGVGSVPTTDPTSFAGQSSLCVLPPIWSRDAAGRRVINLRGLGGFWEAIGKGVIARVFHLAGLGVGQLAGGGKFALLLPEHQVAIKEGEQIEIDYLNPEGRPRAVPVQISGDPFQTYRMDIRVAWGPIPLLAHEKSLLLASTRRSLANVRLERSFRLNSVFIGGVHHFRHHIGADWSLDFMATTGLFKPRLHLPRALPTVQRRLIEAWQRAGAGDFVDTTKNGLALWRRGRYAHNNDQDAHLVVLRESDGRLLVRQVRQRSEGVVYENRSYYRTRGGSYIVHRSQTLRWRDDQPPEIVHEEHFFKDAEAFQIEAPSFFPVVAAAPEQPTLLDERSHAKDPHGENPSA